MSFQIILDKVEKVKHIVSNINDILVNSDEEYLQSLKIELKNFKTGEKSLESIFSNLDKIKSTENAIKDIITKLNKKIKKVSDVSLNRLSEVYKNIKIAFSKYNKEIIQSAEEDFKTISNYIIKEKELLDLSSLDKSKKAIKDLSSLYKYYPHSISIYSYVLQSILYKCDDSLCDFILNELEDLKNFILLKDKKTYCGKKSLFSNNPPMKSFGLTPSNSSKLLGNLTKEIFGESIETRSKLTKLAEKHKTCIIILHKIIKNPLEFGIWKLINRDDAKEYIENSSAGVTKKLVERFNVVEYREETTKDWDFNICCYGSIEYDKFVILEYISNKMYRQLVIYDDMPIKKGGGQVLTTINRTKIKPFIKYIKNGGCMDINTRVSEYNSINEKKILQNLFLPIKFNVFGIKSSSQIIESKILRSDIMKRILEKLNNIMIKEYNDSSRIHTMKDIGAIIHDQRILDIFNSRLVEQYDIYAIKNKEHTSRFPYSETLQTFLSTLHSMNTDFRRLVHDYYIAEKIDIKILKLPDREKREKLSTIFKNIVDKALLKIISDKRNIYQELIYKNSLLNLNLY